jgi:NADP-dependent 3-hydroxy acid dehydrogenase YdfG
LSILILGAASGFGLKTTEAALAQGDKVVATLRNPEALDSLRAKYPADKLLVTKLDVTKFDEIESAFAKAKEAFGRIDVVLNNAGWGAIGETEGTSDDEARAMVEVRTSTMINVPLDQLLV